MRFDWLRFLGLSVIVMNLPYLIDPEVGPWRFLWAAMGCLAGCGLLSLREPS